MPITRLLPILLVVLAMPVLGQTFPSRQISIMVPYPPGSTSDLIPRLISPLMSQSLGVPVIVENRPGAGGNVGAAIVFIGVSGCATHMFGVVAALISGVKSFCGS